MDGSAHSLSSASSYINNLLLSRGLLRSGQVINFAKPHKAEGGTAGTMSQIINLVHDMVLRRDREAEQRENLGMTIRTLHSTETKQKLDLDRLHTQKTESDRQMALAQAQERAHRTTMRTLEASMRDLREEMLRHKTMLQQVRFQCANDIRKRDVQIQKLKSHLTIQQRGARAPLTNSTITIVPTPSTNSAVSGRDSGCEVSLDSPNYSLTQETTDFLTQLSQSLSDENDNLAELLRSTVITLRSVSGLKHSSQPQQPHHGENGGVKAQAAPVAGDADIQLAQNIPISYESLATEVDEVLAHLRIILTSPSFVPVEELEAREEEISRLREGWEKMETRWREAVTLMDGWRKRMMGGGGSVNLEEIKMGLMLSPIKVIEGKDLVRDGPACFDTSGISADDSGMAAGQSSLEAVAVPKVADESQESSMQEQGATDPAGAGVLQEVEPNSKSGQKRQGIKRRAEPAEPKRESKTKRRSIEGLSKVSPERVSQQESKRDSQSREASNETDRKLTRGSIKVQLRGGSPEASKIPRRGTPARRSSMVKRKGKDSLVE
ncbi:MAG: hypothetical protein M1817_000213 [Caeruleum heppii]|nr:MAG: hypothetical protein M1817_000213 [Caeruleum heppii]